jgi:cytidylate kinase
MKKIIITIDGYSSCGKSTLAKQLAKTLHYRFIDSGAMYRAITLYFLRNHVNIKHKKEVENALKNIHLDFATDTQTGKNILLLNEENVETQISEMTVSDAVSDVSALKEVRAFSVAQQQEMGKNKGLVMDGRDIGTAVFPHAELKIFMTADPAIRVERRYKELYEKNKNISLEEVKANLEMRDYIDTNREISPLKKADDAIVLDNSNMSPETQLQKVIHWVKEKMEN